MLDCTEYEGKWRVYEIMDNGDISNNIGKAETAELAWMKAANFLNEKLNKLRKVIEECGIFFNYKED